MSRRPSAPDREAENRGCRVERLAALEDRHAARSFEEIRSALLAGETGAWRVLVEKYSRFVYTVALRLLAGAPGDRAEQVQDTYCRVFDRLRRDDYRLIRGFRGGCRFSTYLYRVVQTARCDVQRGDIRDRERMEPVDFTDEVNRKIEAAVARDSGDPAPADGVLDAGGLRREVERLVDGVSPRDRILLRLRFRKGLKLRELAEALGYRDTNAAAYALRRALKHFDPLKALGRGDWSASDRERVHEALWEVLLE